MHYYKKNIAAYHKKAGRLTMLQHGAYTLLMDCCYDKEEFPTREQALDWLWASSKDEIEAVEFVLSKFFDQEDCGRFVQKRIFDEINEYRAKCKTNKRIALEREKNKAKRKGEDEKREQDDNERAPNYKLLTNNQELETNNQEKDKDNKKVADAPKKTTVKKFEKPTVQDLIKYFTERNSDDALDQANRFFDHFESNGWKVGKTPMKNWQAAVRNWMRNNFSAGNSNQPKNAHTETRQEYLDRINAALGDKY